jgi:hypothetical protein
MACTKTTAGGPQPRGQGAGSQCVRSAPTAPGHKPPSHSAHTQAPDPACVGAPAGCRYVKSRSDPQLAGQPQEPSQMANCDPMLYFNGDPNLVRGGLGLALVALPGA